MSKTRKCPNCGAKIPEDMRFCGSCGADMDAEDGYISDLPRPIRRPDEPRPAETAIRPEKRRGAKRNVWQYIIVLAVIAVVIAAAVILVIRMNQPAEVRQTSESFDTVHVINADGEEIEPACGISVTIGTGLATILSGTRGLPRLPDAFSVFFNKTTVIIILLIVMLIMDFILTRTKFGRKLYYIGNNARTTKVSGIDSENIIMLTYVISGICAGIAGVINTASIGTARANMGPQSQILDIISAAVIGGVSTSGGSGRVRDAVLGAVLIVGLTNVMNLLNVSDYYTTLIKGGIIIAAMGIASYRQQQAAKKGV